jgi:membrane protease YdiL (CAAX protease family)
LGAGTANVVQTALSTVAHFGRAINETASAFPAGLVFGWIDLRCRSIWYIAIIHWTAAMTVEWFLR